jgi:diaminohydroxyphosphoribosylaminopyrimidine deaminase/5-amino-6-(5-phosphoribosylamino)uracil reductase
VTPAVQALDHSRLREALALAESAFGATEPNPRVGCVIGDAQGQVFGSGATQQAGGPHAEVMALRAARSAGHELRGATAWVTLEPCAHHGRTPPCCDALIEAGLGRVVVAVTDPFPAVAGTGISRMRAAGIQVEMADAEIAEAAWQINIGFFSRVLRRRPWVRVKVAASLDGRTGLDNGASQWITGEAARADGHAWRRRASAVMTGIGTVLADDPRLDVRLVPSAGQPLRVVVDSALRTPPGARLLQPPGRVLVATAARRETPAAALEARGAEVLALPAAQGRVDLGGLLAELGRRGVNELHVEAGQQLTTSLLQAGLADELLLYLAPRLLGGQRGIVGWGALERLDQGLEFQLLESRAIGADLRLRLRPVAVPLFSRPTGAQPASAPFTSAPPPE